MKNNLSLSKNQSLFVVDLENVSFFNKKTIIQKTQNDEEYYKTPFLYLVFSYIRNQAMNWADENYTFIEKKKTGAWMVYKFGF